MEGEIKLKNVVIIGAGPAGLTAGYELLKNSKDFNVVILEETEAIGGISKTVYYNGNRMDIGGHRFFSKDERVNAFWEEIMPLQGAPAFDDLVLNREKDYAENGPDPEEVDRVMLLRDRVSRIYYKNTFFDYPVSLSWNTIKGMGFVTTVKAGFSYLKSVFKKLPETTLENFYINRFGKVLYSMFFEGYTEKLWGRHPSEISAEWGSQRVKGLSIMGVIKNAFRKIFSKNSAATETSLIEQFHYPKFGPGQLWETVANRFSELGGKILHNSKVEKLIVDEINGKVKSVVFEQNGKKMKIDADIFISSMPVKDLVAGIESDNIPPEVRNAAKTLPYRDFVTVGLLVNKLNLENKTKIKTLSNIIPDCWIYVQDTNVKLGRIQIFNNWSPYMVSAPENTVWIGLEYFCDEGDAFWNMEDGECIKFAVDELVSMGIIYQDDVLDAHREKVKKAYPAYFDGYAYIDYITEYLDKYSNLYCVGRNGQHRYNNMDHSMATAFNTVENILNGVNDKSNIWNVNTEKDYHEEK
ncbi:MAG: NAD(P)/FAD-dependent oxidoreductase [Clostridia bacterium]|nr:NAD(P)/FAD-dependent oxidoreductase [Clostridia bacterium]